MASARTSSRRGPGHELILVQAPLLRVWSWWALARMNRRDTDEALSLKASAPLPHWRRTPDNSGRPGPSETGRRPRPAGLEPLVRGQRDLLARADPGREAPGPAPSDRRGRPSLVAAPADDAGRPPLRRYRAPANATTSACIASPTAWSPSGINAWISATVLSISSSVDARPSRLPVKPSGNLTEAGPLVLSLNPDYSFHEAAPFLWCGVVVV